MSIKTKLALILTLAVAGSASASMVIFCLFEYRQLQAEAASKQSVLMGSVLNLVREAELANDPLMMFDYLRNLMREHEEIARTRVFTNGRWVDVKLVAKLKKKDSYPLEDTFSRVAASTRFKAEVFFSKRVIDERSSRALSLVVTDTARIAAVIALLGCLLAFPLSASLTKRLVRIQWVLRRIGEGDLSVKARVSGKDEIAELAEGVNAMSERLSELDEMKKTFVASVTHELRTPLVVIESYVKLLLSSHKDLDENARASLEKIGESAQRLSHFVTNLLDLAKLERGKLEFSPRPADLASIVEDAVSFFKPRADELGIRLALQSEKGLPLLQVDPDLITHVLTNLLSNAMKYSRRGGAVSVELKRVNGCVECDVTDSGVGIPPEAIGRIFSPFERVKNSVHARGVGLGLSIAKSIVQMHGGDIGVSSEPEHGSRFYFQLPLSAA